MSTEFLVGAGIAVAVLAGIAYAFLRKRNHSAPNGQPMTKDEFERRNGGRAP